MYIEFITQHKQSSVVFTVSTATLLIYDSEEKFHWESSNNTASILIIDNSSSLVTSWAKGICTCTSTPLQRLKGIFYLHRIAVPSPEYSWYTSKTDQFLVKILIFFEKKIHRHFSTLLFFVIICSKISRVR